MTPSSGSINFLEQLTELREILTFTSLSKDMIKDTDEQPDEVLHRVRCGRGPERRSFCPRGVGMPHLPGVNVFANLDAL